MHFVQPAKDQNPWHMHIFNTYTNIQQNKRVFYQKLWEELAGQMTYPTYASFSNKGATLHAAREVRMIRNSVPT
jgi:hypothetical protein